VLSGRGLCEELITLQKIPNESDVCVCAIECGQCNSDLLHLQWLGRKGQTKKERMKESKAFNEIRKKKGRLIRNTTY